MMTVLTEPMVDPRIRQQLVEDSYDSADCPSDLEEDEDEEGHPHHGDERHQGGDSAETSVSAIARGEGAGGPGDASFGMSHDSSYSYTEADEVPVVLITTVDIGNGRMGRIQVHEGEDTVEVARCFCEEHGLPAEVVVPLSKHLAENIEALSGKRSKAQDTMGGVGKRGASARRKAPHHSQQPLRKSDGRPEKGGRLYHSTGEQHVHVWVEGRKSQHRSSHGDQNLPPVHERLYAQAELNERRKHERAAELQAELDAELESQRENISWVSRELASGRDVGEYLNYGERLYVEGVVEMERKKQVADARRKEEEMSELDGVTFRPRISSMAAEIHRPTNLSTWERLNRGYSNQKDTLEARKRLQQQEDAAKETVECTFKPVINRRSQKMMTGRTAILREHQITAHEQLFQDAIRRQLRQDEYEEWYPEDVTFHPQTNPHDAWKRASAAAAIRASATSLRSSHEGSPHGSPGSSIDLPPNYFRGPGPSQMPEALANVNPAKRHSAPARPKGHLASQSSVGVSSVHGSYCGPIPKETPAFANRLYAYKDQFAKNAAARAAAETPKFVPKTGRGPAPGYGRDLRGRSVGEYLYNKHHEIESKKEFLSEQMLREEEDQRRTSKMTSTSEHLMENLKRRRFSQIFSFLDAANEGALDLVGIALAEHDRLQHLDTEVRADVVEAARLLQARRDAFARRCEADQSMSAEEIPEVLLVDAEGFSALMDEVLSAAKGVPRPYLQPAPVSSRLDYPEYNHHPHINAKSKELASKRRPGNVPAHKAMLQEWEQNRLKQEIQKAAKEEAELEGCTFEPQLVSEQLVSHGRALRMSQALLTSVASTEWEKTGDLELQQQQQQQPKERRPKKKGHGQQQQKQQQIRNEEGSPVQPSTSQDLPGARGGAPEEEGDAAESAKSTPAKSLLELAEMSMDPSLGGETEQVLKHLGEQDAAEFRFMQQELQQILLQSPVARGAGGGGSTGSGSGGAGGGVHNVTGARAAPAPSPGIVGSTSTHPSSVQGTVQGMSASEGARNAGANVWFRHGTEQRQWQLDDVLATDSEDDEETRVPPEAPRRVPGSASRPYEAEAGLRKDDGTPLSAADLIGALAGRRRASAQPQ